jgi:hypothetical protein
VNARGIESELQTEAESAAGSAVPTPDAGGARRTGQPGLRRSKGARRAFGALYVVTTLLVAAGVLVQAFSIAAYIRGAGKDALELHTTGGLVTHNLEIVAFLAALVGFWGAWRPVGLALLLPVVGTIQVLLIGDTDKTGGWINGLHGLLALVVLLLALLLAQAGMRALRGAGGGITAAPPP